MAIDVVHDKVGSYAMWDAADRYERHTVRVMEDYLLGRREARYPVPSTLGQVVIYDDCIIFDLPMCKE